ncbi:MAG: EAL domain-containing protein [Gammaproteobacteria bacterium]|nr:EAL domain-containing protein [Gammaproteobacteria bacterium]MDH5514606.1 EAL domain-containing protein [Gammaproteobacteria bacterium]
MKIIKNISVRHKLMLISMAITMASLLLASVAFITSDRLYAQKTVVDGLNTMTDMIAANSSAAILFGDADAALETLGFLKSQGNIQAGALYLKDGDVFATYRRNGFNGELPAPGSNKQDVKFSDKYTEVFRPIVYKNDPIGIVYLRSDMSAVHDRLSWFLWIVVITLVTSLVFAFALSTQLQRIITDPLLRLSAIARRISTEKNFDLRVSGHGRDELGNLIGDFNTMLNEIQTRDRQLKEHQAELEERVAIRTQELEIANIELASSKEQAEAVAKRMEYHAHHDALTGLPNRILLNDRIHKGLAHARRQQSMLALLFLDLDRFKIINDSLGHAVGDQLLRVISRRLKSCLREGDTIARLGGDEFMVLLPDIKSASDAGKIGNKIIKSLTDSISCNGHELHITTSVGISVYPFDGADADTLVKHADISMYRAKDIGRNRMVYYTAEMNAGSRKKLALETSLRSALGKKQLHLVYQPKIDITRNQIIGVEALLRWKHPAMGYVSPLEFIPIAEESGLIIPIGEWVLNTAFRQLREWHDAGFDELTMAVNLSSAQLSRPGFEDIMEHALSNSGISADKAELEITENVAMRNIDSAIMTLQKFKDKGMSIAMDDFGTGYSSLGYLRKLPIDTVKIDRSFVSELPDSKDDALIAQTIIAMAHSMNLGLVVEGVENVRQLNFFKKQGCHIVQGFLFSKPLLADELLEMLRTHDTRAIINLVRK